MSDHPIYSERSTYIAEAALAGANNKDMLSILNPPSSGVVVRIHSMWAVVPSSSGINVIIPFEVRSATAVTTGSTVTAKKFDSQDPGASAVVRQAPTGISDHAVPLYYTWIEQINTAIGNQGSAPGNTPADSQAKPIVLREGEGLYLRQIANNTSTFRVGFLWTEELP